MFRSIVVGTDGSQTAAVAVRKACQLAALTDARLHVVSAYRSMATVSAMAAAGGAGVPMQAAEVDADLCNEALTLLDAAVPDEHRKLDVERHARPGGAADVLLAVAKEQDADLIVVGSRGMSGARRLLGSVPNRVAHAAPCAVMIVHTT
jgi:nucleotide-binding universal stress UspA family protein